MSVAGSGQGYEVEVFDRPTKQVLVRYEDPLDPPPLARIEKAVGRFVKRTFGQAYVARYDELGAVPIDWATDRRAGRMYRAVPAP